MDTDFFLIKRMRQGDEASMDSFVRKYYPDILFYCKNHSMDKEYAKDLAQETFLRFFEHLAEYRHLGKAKNFLYTIAGNLCKDYYKKIAEIPAEDLPETGENQTEQMQNKLLVEGALIKLPEEFREVVILYYFQELKLKEIADLLHIGLPLVKYRLRRAKELLEGMLREEEPI